MIRILSYGGGTQSSAILVMSCLGDFGLPRLDHAIFADTGWEPPAVYRYVDLMEKFATSHGVQFHRVSNGNLREETVRCADNPKGRSRFVSLPFLTLDPKAPPKKRHGMVRRQCSDEYKIKPINNKVREIAGIKPRSRGPKHPVVEQWFGFSLDEAQRERASTKRWISYRHPLIYDRPTRREGSIMYLESKGLPTPPRSACIGCPFHDHREWQSILADPAMREDAFEYDESVRTSPDMRSSRYLHYLRRPLRELWAEGHFEQKDDPQGDMFGVARQECTGACGT
jgi:hypothetical protein